MNRGTVEHRRATLAGVAAIGLSVVVACGGIEWWPGAPARADLWAVAPLGNGELLAVGSTDNRWGELVAARSSDAGKTWTLSTVPGTPGLTRLAMAGNRLFASIECVPPSSGGQTLEPVPSSCLYVSSDRGMTWSDARAGRVVDPTFADASYGWVHPEGSAGGVLSETTDGGSSWGDYLDPCPSDTPVIHAAVATARRAGYVTCFAIPGTGDQPWQLVQVSPDGTLTTRYQEVAAIGGATQGLLDDYPQGLTMQASGRGLIWASAGIYETTDGGTTWTTLPADGLDRGSFRGGGTIAADGDAYLIRVENFSEVVQRHAGEWRTLAKWPITSGG